MLGSAFHPLGHPGRVGGLKLSLTNHRIMGGGLRCPKNEARPSSEVTGEWAAGTDEPTPTPIPTSGLHGPRGSAFLRRGCRVCSEAGAWLGLESSERRRPLPTGRGVGDAFAAALSEPSSSGWRGAGPAGAHSDAGEPAGCRAPRRGPRLGLRSALLRAPFSTHAHGPGRLSGRCRVGRAFGSCGCCKGRERPESALQFRPWKCGPQALACKWHRVRGPRGVTRAGARAEQDRLRSPEARESPAPSSRLQRRSPAPPLPA